MTTQQAQIKLSLLIQLKNSILSRADRYGLPLAGYIRFLILKDVEKIDYPTYKASTQVEKNYKTAMKEKNKAVKVKGDIGEFLDSL